MFVMHAWGPELKSQNPYENVGVVVCALLVSRDRWIPRSFWATSLACMVSSRTMRDPSSKNKMDSAWGMIPKVNLWPLLHMLHVCMHTDAEDTCTHKYTRGSSCSSYTPGQCWVSSILYASSGWDKLVFQLVTSLTYLEGSAQDWSKSFS